MGTRLSWLVTCVLGCFVAFAQSSDDLKLAHQLADPDVRQIALDRLSRAGVSKLPLLLLWTQKPPSQVDQHGLTVGLADAFGELKPKKGIPYLLNNISIERSFFAAPNTWMKTPETVLSRRPAITALIRIGLDASLAITEGSWRPKDPDERLAAILVVSRIRGNPHARQYIGAFLGEANELHFWAEKGMQRLESSDTESHSP